MRKHVALAVAVVLSVLISSAKSRIELANSRVDPGRGLSSEWLILTKQNFSSEMRLHPHILLLVTIPWCGEARTLMKQIADLVSDQQEKHGHLRLMVVYKNSEKILSEILGAVEDITLFYYYQFTSYKYNGRLRAENILYSVNYLASLNSEDVPLKLLHSREELEVFLKSTDKAVLLIELCGWSTKLLQKRSTMQFSLSLQNYSENDNMFGASLFQNVDEKLPLDKNQEGMDIEGLTCVENELPVSHLNGEFSWANHSVAEGIEHENGDTNMSCTGEEYKLFEMFFSNFTRIAREHLLPLERTRFGLIPERTLLPYIGAKNMGAWLTMVQFNGCPRCSMILKAEDDLKKVLRENHSPVMQVDMDGDSLEPAFPENRPSVVLFIDRLSDLPSMREKSKSALEALMILSKHYQMPYTVTMGAPGVYTRSSPQAYDALLDFLSNRNSVRRKKTKISFLAKEVGFQLLSDDFEIQVMDSTPNDQDKKQLSDMNEHTITSLGDQALVLDQTSHEDFPREKDYTPTVLEVATVDNVNNFEHENAVDDLQKYQETDIKDKENTDEIGTIIVQELKDDSSNFLKSVCNEDDGGCKKNDVGSLACQDQTCSLKQVEVVETCIEKSRVKDVGCGSNSYRSVEKVMLDDPKEDFTENDVDDNQKNMQMPLLSQPHIQNQSFQGSFFFVDGGYRLLRSLTGGSNVPSLVLLDPIMQHHYVFNEDVDITYSSLVNFLDKFLNGSLSPYQLSASSAISYKEPQKPPFVNLVSMRLTLSLSDNQYFCELVFGFDPCVSGVNGSLVGGLCILAVSLFISWGVPPWEDQAVSGLRQYANCLIAYWKFMLSQQSEALGSLFTGVTLVLSGLKAET
ncbi:hypothetical protein HPP92_008562 [Vanilla planifolia]|uniref:Uncharacterized protein n=1 Tax=Vanilla planifolia TaxID=51239 RepID=A0A835R6B7_VANPL|nr:hypothetical protein HPP92_008562 [Vanilla planifolia]